MADFSLYANTFHLGTFGDDYLEAGTGEHVVLGLGGDNTLVSHRGGWPPSLVTLAGGQGDDTYYASADVTQIVDTGGRDTLYLPGYRDDFEGAFLDGRDLILANAWTGQVVIVLDFKNAGRIERLIDYAGVTYSANEVERMVYRDGYGDITYTQMQMITGDHTFNVNDFHAARDIDLAIPKLNWHNVFLHLEERGSLDNTAIADAVQYEIWPLLSLPARQLWESAGAYQALLESTFNGLEANVTLPVAPPVARGVVEQLALLYEAALNRAPDMNGLNYWVDRAKEGHGVIDIAGYFLISDEFQSALGGERGDSHYLDKLYLNVLGREADTSGSDYWMNQLQNGLTRQEVLLYFADSAENRDNAGWLAGLGETTDGGWVLG
ncbi:DUF4214 domain-containing protein [Halomonas sp. ANAO-440]|uniref:DUF4214 domain-containing protein n=1 Tax=Halomonas sp. ANAO-440 TaxID=2861360 RepID=UPI001CAA7348|nr:DUF4214 domain-containing protein [Halomonas sp. ANAO-440]MBZ0332070.1 DUF4214 domain-containing protein [Halomonas sp. ANAO-440]